jgi:hypothetical protein
MAEDVQYRGWKIERQSYKSERALWHPKALVSTVMFTSIA